MTRDDNPGRCTHRARQRDGSEIECSDQGGWTLDKDRHTWRAVRPSDKSRRCWAHGPGSETKPYGPRRRVTKPNARIQLAAGLLLDLSPQVTKALEQISEELAQLGFPSSSSRGALYGDAVDPVGGDAVSIHELTGWREDIRDWITDLCHRVDAGILLIARVRKVDHAHGVKLCAENQQGREGSIVWGDPTCTELPTQNGLCAKDYQAERRWRQSTGKATSEVPAA